MYLSLKNWNILRFALGETERETGACVGSSGVCTLALCGALRACSPIVLSLAAR